MPIENIAGWILAAVLSLLAASASASKRESIDFQPCPDDLPKPGTTCAARPLSFAGGE
jgi:hypothetical protein